MQPRRLQSNRYLRDHWHISTLHRPKNRIPLTISSNTGVPNTLHKAQNTVQSRPLQHDFKNTLCYSCLAPNHVNSSVVHQNPIHTQKACATEIVQKLKDASNHMLEHKKTCQAVRHMGRLPEICSPGHCSPIAIYESTCPSQLYTLQKNAIHLTFH